MKTIIVVVSDNVHQVAMTPPNTAVGSEMTMPDGRMFKRTKVKYRKNGQMIYYYKQVDTTGK